jgi:ribosomal protein S14|uniref:Ribosomal protein S14 n=1 Tax=Baffinella frigidus TaxID=2571260 RepID=A0A6C0X6R6_9CRYP|nr:ribosomal protein S14 [Cryptophyta sp. CCMP2293]
MKISRDKNNRILYKQSESKLLLAKILIRTTFSLSKVLGVSYKNLIKRTLVCVKNRCVLTGRSNGIYTDFKISRIKLRELALDCLINGVKKASW